MPPATRIPLYGAIGPKTAIAVSINPPLEHEQVLVISSTPSETVSKTMKDDVVAIANNSNKPIAYMLVFAPANVALPPPEAWMDLWTQILGKVRVVMKR